MERTNVSQNQKEQRDQMRKAQAIPGVHGPNLPCTKVGDGKEKVNLVSRFPKTRVSWV